MFMYGAGDENRSLKLGLVNLPTEVWTNELCPLANWAWPCWNLCVPVCNIYVGARA